MLLLLPYSVSVAVHWTTRSVATTLCLCRLQLVPGRHPPSIDERFSGTYPIYNLHCIAYGVNEKRHG